MRKKFLILFMSLSLGVFARDINVGDKLKLQISNIEKEDVKKYIDEEKFLISKIKEENDKVVLEIIPLEVGNLKIQFPQNSVEIKVKSVLEKEDKNINNHYSDKSDMIVFDSDLIYCYVGIFILMMLSLVYLLKNHNWKRERKLSPEKEFDVAIKSIDASRRESIFEMSMIIRKYIDRKYTLNFVAGNYLEYKEIHSEDVEFLKKLDLYKYSNEEVDMKIIYEKIIKIYEKVKRGEK